MWKNNDCPCTKDCPDRVPACHATCPKYKQWSEKRAADKKAQAKHAERYADTESKKRARWASYRRDYSGAKKKFSG